MCDVICLLSPELSGPPSAPLAQVQCVRFCDLGSALTTKNCRAGKSKGQTEPELGQQTEENVSDLIQLDCQYLEPQSQQIQLSSYNSNAVNRPDSPSPDASLWPHLLTSITLFPYSLLEWRHS